MVKTSKKTVKLTQEIELEIEKDNTISYNGGSPFIPLSRLWTQALGIKKGQKTKIKLELDIKKRQVITSF